MINSSEKTANVLISLILFVMIVVLALQIANA